MQFNRNNVTLCFLRLYPVDQSRVEDGGMVETNRNTEGQSQPEIEARNGALSLSTNHQDSSNIEGQDANRHGPSGSPRSKKND